MVVYIESMFGIHSPVRTVGCGGKGCKMCAKRNPFNENVNRLMEKIFSGGKISHAPQKEYQEEKLPQREDGIIHDTQTGKRNTGAKKSREGAFGAPLQGTEENGGKFLAGTDEPVPKEKKGDFSGPMEFSLQDIRRTTEKIRQTTKQMQQMTLQMWAETAQVQEKQKGAYGTQRIPPRKSSFGQGVAAPTPAPSPRTFAPQYRVEEALDASVPERIRECRQLARSPQGYRMTKEELFFRQAQMMEDYVDDCLYPGDFTWYFPTYQAMNVAQLRGYFTWRAQVRQGNIMPAPLSFAFVYVYELLHQIGAKTPEEGFSLLKTFWEGYREYDIQLDRYLQNWLCDYVVYYNLDQKLLVQSQDVMFDKAMLAFRMHPEEENDTEYFAAICALSRYNMEGSKFYKEYPQDVCRVTCGVFRALAAYYEKHGKKTLVEKYFGTLTTCAYQMFASAVFYDHKKYANYEYAINPLHRYRCVDGHWSCEKYFGNRTKNKEMGFILHAIDAQMRQRYAYPSPLKPEGMTKLVMNIIGKEIDRLQKEKEKNAAPVIEIDLSKLSGIRRAADLTRERLIVEGAEEGLEPEIGNGRAEEGYREQSAGEGQLEFVWENNAGAAGDIPQKSAAASGDMKRIGYVEDIGRIECAGDAGQVEHTRQAEQIGHTEDAGHAKQIGQAGDAKHTGHAEQIGQDNLLNEAERTLLHCLLDGTPYQAFLRERHLMLSVVVDAVNEKLFDHFGDTVIVFDGDTPEVLEDYAEEAAEILSGAEA